MAHFIQFFNAQTGESTPLSHIDEQICLLIGTTVHPTFYGGTGQNQFNWYDSIAFQLTQYESYELVQQHYTKSEMWQQELPIITKIIEFLKSNYTVHTWFGR